MQGTPPRENPKKKERKSPNLNSGKWAPFHSKELPKFSEVKEKRLGGSPYPNH